MHQLKQIFSSTTK